ncbi:hypothetical protein CYL18_06190 [Pradoshia eiseniae]|uniref:IstB-like ATP-binding domain-containing protein n=1 Tax=Pradoshia eiseniae TaxID=2064768 RepID=A0A2S7N2H1_9BACI|nr:hypothetical protein CYL18_06190 [Pradoshia eiseniae]
MKTAGSPALLSFTSARIGCFVTFLATSITSLTEYTCRFIENGDNILLLGPPGVEKAHLAIDLALEALIQGYSAYYTRCDDFITTCKKANSRGTTGRLVNKLSNFNVLILDEMRYFPKKLLHKSNHLTVR